MAEDLQELAVDDNMGDALFKAGRYAGAVEAFRRCVELRDKLAAAEPGNVECLRELSVSHAKMGDALVGVAGVWNANISDTRVAPERLSGALVAYRKSELILEGLTAAYPANAGLQRDLSVTYDKIGDMLLVTGKIDEALAMYRKDLAIAEKLAAAHPENLDYRRDLVVSYDRVGDALLAGGRIDDAIATYRLKLPIAQQLGALDPDKVEKIGDLLRAAGRTDEALARYRLSLAILEEGAARDPVNWIWWQAKISRCRAKLDRQKNAKRLSIIYQGTMLTAISLLLGAILGYLIGTPGNGLLLVVGLLLFVVSLAFRSQLHTAGK